MQHEKEAERAFIEMGDLLTKTSKLGIIGQAMAMKDILQIYSDLYERGRLQGIEEGFKEGYEKRSTELNKLN